MTLGTLVSTLIIQGSHLISGTVHSVLAIDLIIIAAGIIHTGALTGTLGDQVTIGTIGDGITITDHGALHIRITTDQTTTTSVNMWPRYIATTLAPLVP